MERRLRYSTTCGGCDRRGDRASCSIALHAPSRMVGAPQARPARSRGPVLGHHAQTRRPRPTTCGTATRWPSLRVLGRRRFHGERRQDPAEGGRMMQPPLCRLPYPTRRRLPWTAADGLCGPREVRSPRGPATLAGFAKKKARALHYLRPATMHIRVVRAHPPGGSHRGCRQGAARSTDRTSVLALNVPSLGAGTNQRQLLVDPEVHQEPGILHFQVPGIAASTQFVDQL